MIFNNYIQPQRVAGFVSYDNTETGKIEELYKQLLKEKDEVIALLKKETSLL